jgi:hypothetical protein
MEMASKSKARKIVASEKLVGLIDRGFEVDTDLKNLGFEDKGIKKMLTEELEPEFKDGEKTRTEPVRVEATKAAATVSIAEKYEVDAANPSFEGVRKAAQAGLYGKVVEMETLINIPSAERERAAMILKAAGIGVTTSTVVSVDPEGYREMLVSPAVSAEAAEARRVLQESVTKTTGFRVKYEKL